MNTASMKQDDLLVEFSKISNTTRQYYCHIDGLRAFAILLVLLSHIGIKEFSGGYIGVDVFFVISGFIISKQVIDELSTSNSFNLRNFFSRRIRRLFPALAFTLKVSCILAVFLLNDAKLQVFGKSLISTATSFANIHFFKQAGYFDAFSQSNPLLHTWSLSVEEQFYIIWPLLIFIFFRIRKITTVLIMMVVIFAASLALNVYYQYRSPPMIYYLMPFRAFELVAGGILVYIFHFKIHNILKEALCLLGAMFIAYSALHFNEHTVFPSYNALLPVMGASMLIYGAHSSRGVISKILCFYPIRYIGIISYSLYLIHWPIIVYAQTLLEDLELETELNLFLKIIILFISILISSFMYHYIESPFKKVQIGSFENKYKVICLGMVTVIFFLMIGKCIQNPKLWSWRTIASTKEDLSTYHYKHWGGVNFRDGIIYQGNTKTPKVVMLGDSHLGMLASGMVKYLSRPYNITTYAVFGGGGGKYPTCLCLPKLTLLDGKNQKYYDTGCADEYLDALKMLSQSPDSVLIVSFAYSTKLPLTAYEKTHTLINIDPGRMDKYVQYKPFIHSLDALRKKIENRKMIIIGDVPGSNFVPSKCLNKLKIFAQKKCANEDPISRGVGQNNINNILEEYAKHHKNVYFINPYKAFCNKNSCESISSQGLAYYSDGYHLSISGSKHLMANIKMDILRRIT